jgi:hypothetical protein
LPGRYVAAVCQLRDSEYNGTNIYDYVLFDRGSVERLDFFGEVPPARSLTSQLLPRSTALQPPDRCWVLLATKHLLEHLDQGYHSQTRSSTSKQNQEVEDAVRSHADILFNMVRDGIVKGKQRPCRAPAVIPSLSRSVRGLNSF